MATSLLDRVGRVARLQHALSILATLIGTNVMAQSAPPTPSSSGAVGAAVGVGVAPSEALQRQALGPYRMILRNAAPPSKPRAVAAHAVSAPTANLATAPRASSPKPVPAPEPSQPASATEAAVADEAPVTPIAAPTVQAIEAPVAPADATPSQPVAIAAKTSPAPPPAAKPTKTALVLLKNDPPTLSGPLAREGPSGIVRVAFNVNPDGSTGDLKIATSNNRRLNGAVLAAISKWRYQPIDSVQAAEVEVVFSND